VKYFIYLATVLALINNANAADYNLGVKAGSSWGKTKNSTTSIASRSMLTHEVALQPGMKFDDWTFGLALGWRFRRQLTEPREVANTNLKGSGYHAGLLAKWDVGTWSLLGEVDISADYGLSNKDPVQQEIVYKCPIGFCGFGITAETAVWNDFLIEGGIKHQRWGKVDVASAGNDISDSRLTEWRVYLGTGMNFGL
jgi:hypothetical protein